jgi:aminoglycoside phosphotransferase (APT) family kinase protein
MQKLNQEERDEALDNIARTVSELHSARIAGYGHFRNSSSIVEEPLLVALQRHADQTIRSPDLLDRFRSVLDRRSADFCGSLRAGITHEDLHGFNILFAEDHPTRVSAVLDFDKAWVGPVESDIARMTLWTFMMSSRSMEVYRVRIPEDDGYDVRRSIYQLLWCFEFAQQTPEHLRTTNELCRTLGIKAVEAFS